MKAAILSLGLVILLVGEVRGETVDELLARGFSKRDEGANETADRAKRRKLLEEALAIFERAHDREGSGRTAGLLGISEALVEKWGESEEHIEGALRMGSDPWVRRNRELLEKWLVEVRGHFGEMVVTGTPSGAAVWVDGKMRGNLPLPGAIRVPAGEVQLQVNAPGGYQPSLQRVTVKVGELSTVEVGLEKVQMLEISPRPPKEDGYNGAVAKGMGDNPSSSRWSKGKIAGFVMGGVGLAAVGVGTALALRGCEADARGLGCLKPPSPWPGVAVGAAGAAVAVGGLALWWVNKDVNVSVGPSSVAIALGGTF